MLANMKLKSDAKEKLREVTIVIERARNARNDLNHHLWGITLNEESKTVGAQMISRTKGSTKNFGLQKTTKIYELEELEVILADIQLATDKLVSWHHENVKALTPPFDDKVP